MVAEFNDNDTATTTLSTMECLETLAVMDSDVEGETDAEDLLAEN